MITGEIGGLDIYLKKSTELDHISLISEFCVVRNRLIKINFVTSFFEYGYAEKLLYDSFLHQEV